MPKHHGVSPLIWGPACWKMLHMMAAAYPETPTDIDKENAYNYFLALGGMLPCEFCKKHYRTTLSALNFNMNVFDSQETLFRFVFDLHNAVNARLRKPIVEDYFYVRHKYDLYKQL